ncbi:1-acyl-sn-glycerol-3-phosphate acyltransferase [Paracoccus alcaliphilus]|uniref:1-acyl-sn-glycerol-3-phosphate acyltransferase n=1 Tax=Paracoccus alcaliphilus TaxID=34002 RepID=A0A1H8FED8_9RHOB|nr:lysophospholipid acyltransferase family protein [Paracoccus alcaliphilus]WCR19274.1 1-acyl-sn-glycerol-3-phosphate acyltransferase [Paracoccus alcaliphilus]SEN29940.1 1-acyl-sn-glycerol-3-phosphate acyltransferase [Paracoccus alcaliphilus]
MSRRGDSPRPGPLTPWQYVQNGLFYLHVALATLIMGLVGIPLVMSGGRAGANRVATRWIGYVLWAARLHMRVSCEVRGVLPAGDCIVAAKHQCFLDILTLAYALPRRNFIMKREVMRVPVMGWYAWKVGCIPIDRSRGRDAMRAINGQIRERMAGDGLGQLIIYPEGTRTRPGERRAYKHGVGSIREATGLPVVPVAVNTGLFWPRSGWGIRPGRAVIEFLPVIAAESTEEFMSRLEERVETRSDQLMEEAGYRHALAE